MSANGKSHLRYIQAEEALAHLLETGGYRPGDQLPPEPTLARQLGVSRATLREALRSFEQQGSISRRQGVGTFVNAKHLYVESGLEVLLSMEDLLAGRAAAGAALAAIGAISLTAQIGLLKANVALALKRPDLGDAARAAISGLL